MNRENDKTLLHIRNFYFDSGFFGQEKLTTSNSDPTVMLKFTAGPGFKQDSCSGSEEGFLNVKAQNFGLHFKSSSLTTITNFIEDRKDGDSLPLHIDVSHFMLILQVRIVCRFCLSKN